MAERKAVRVLPEPVGAATRVLRPARIAGQARRWAAVGAAKVARNQAATAGWKPSRAAAWVEVMGHNMSCVEVSLKGVGPMVVPSIRHRCRWALDSTLPHGDLLPECNCQGEPSWAFNATTGSWKRCSRKSCRDSAAWSHGKRMETSPCSSRAFMTRAPSPCPPWTPRS
ncbi:hypothetical protein D3C76_1270830 [compost metagenome]